MANRVFHFFLVFLLAITVLFLAAPLLVLLRQGADGLVPCLMSEEVLFSIKLSLQTTVAATAVCTLVAVPVSYELSKIRGKWQKMMENILYLPMSLPHLVSGIALLLLFGRKGIGDWLYTNLGLDFIFTAKGIVLAQVFVNLPFALNMMGTAQEESNKRMVFIARTLGCNEWQAFCNITLPLLRRTIVSCAVMVWCRALGEFGAVIMVAGTTRLKTEILPTAIYLNLATGDLDLAAGIAVILIAISLICLILFELFMPRRPKSGGQGGKRNAASFPSFRESRNI